MSDEGIQAWEDRRTETLRGLISGETPACCHVAVEWNGRTHWWGYVHEGATWVMFCTGLTTDEGKPIRGHIRDCPTLPLCSVCQTASEILEDA